jgi:L-iditol 2-dehydrogenase
MARSGGSPRVNRVAMYYSNRDVRLEELPLPRVGPGEMLVRVEASGICGSDLMEWYRKDKVPLVLGHEIAGVVAEVGAGVTSFAMGDRVVATHHVPCNTCAHCLRGNHTVCETLRRTHFDPGGFCEYVRLEPAHIDRGVLKLPDEVTLEEATFVEPLGCALRAQRRAGLLPGRSVLVIGSGIAGLLHVQAARAAGASPIVAVDVRESRLELAKRLGADATIPATADVPARLRALNGGRLADLVIVCAGAAAAIEQGLKAVERGGTVVLFAPTEAGATIPISVNDVFWRTDVTLTTSYAAGLEDLAQALELIRGRRVDVAGMITHRVSLAETGRGFALLLDGREAVKVIVEPQR